MLSIKTIILLGGLLSTALCDEIYATFLSPNGHGGQQSSVDFDVGNNGCFSVPGADIVSFSHNFNLIQESAQGPYCLNAYAYASCPGWANGQQTFSNVDLGSNAASPKQYRLNVGVENAGSYRWSLGQCNGT